MNTNVGQYFNAHALVLINGIVIHQFGVNENVVNIETHNDSNHLGSYCEITLPTNVRILYQNDPTQVGTATSFKQAVFSRYNNQYVSQPLKVMFNTGDHIQIFAKYEGYESDVNAVSVSELDVNDKYLPVFDGFLYDFYESTPIKIKCLDYFYWFNIGIFGQIIKQPTDYPKTTFKQILTDVLAAVNKNISDYNSENNMSFPAITLSSSIFDMNLVDIHFPMCSPAAVLEYFKKEMGLCITLLGNVLYVNVASNTTGVVALQTDVNVINSSLQTTNFQHSSKTGSNSVFQSIKLRANFLNVKGLKEYLEIGDENGSLREVYFYNVTKGANTLYLGKTVPANYLSMAQAAWVKMKQDRYSGEVETYLYPYCDLFWKVKYYDIRYPERNGNYVITLISQSIGESGFHRKLKLAYLDS